MQQTDKLLEATRHLIEGASNHEFPITTMTQALREQLEQLSLEGAPLAALDVGTGTGIHAYVLAAKGFAVVDAIDRCGKSVQSAHERLADVGFAHSRIVEELTDPRTEEREGIRFLASDMMDLPDQLGASYDSICFNPPAFYSSQPIDIGDPAESGVFAGVLEEAREVDRGHLYRFFDSVVRRLLAVGGHVVCTWPGLERRAVGEQVGIPSPDAPKHPVVLLREWFGFTIETSDSLEWEEFYSKRARLEHNYGIESFWANLALSDDEHCLSRYLFRGQDKREGGCPTFQFGVLHLERLGDDRFVHHA